MDTLSPVCGQANGQAGHLPDAPRPAGSPPAMLTLSEAAAACGVGRSTIRRRLDSGAFPGAVREHGPDGPATGPWRIPAPELLASGLTLARPEPPAGPPAGQGRVQAPDGVEFATLRAEVAGLRALLAERERVVEAQALALRLLGAGEGPTSVQAPLEAAASATPEPATPAAEPEGKTGALRAAWRRFLAA